MGLGRVGLGNDGRALLGRRAEDLAADLLESLGFRIVERNWRRAEGELDLVADDAGVCVFVEVRSRTGLAFGDPLESVTPYKQARVVRAARCYLAEVAPRASGFRFDVIGVTFDEHGAPPRCVHVPDAFRTDGVV